MSKKLLIGTVGMCVALGAGANVAYANNPNVPSFSPYAIMAYDVPAAPPAMEPIRREHRAAYQDAALSNDAVPAANANVPSFSPYVLVPQGR
jgi:hypothetical protein